MAVLVMSCPKHPVLHLRAAIACLTQGARGGKKVSVGHSSLAWLPAHLGEAGTNAGVGFSPLAPVTLNYCLELLLLQ